PRRRPGGTASAPGRTPGLQGPARPPGRAAHRTAHHRRRQGARHPPGSGGRGARRTDAAGRSDGAGRRRADRGLREPGQPAGPATGARADGGAPGGGSAVPRAGHGAARPQRPRPRPRRRRARPARPARGPARARHARRRRSERPGRCGGRRRDPAPVGPVPPHRPGGGRRPDPGQRADQLQRGDRADPRATRPGPTRAPARVDDRQRGRAARPAPPRSGGAAMSPTAADPARAPDRRRSVTRSVLRGAGVILVVTVFARILGFVRYLVFGASIGAGDVGTAYTTANMLPTVLFEIAAGGVLAAVVVPLIAGLVPEGDPADHVGAGADGPGATGRAAGMPYPVDGEQGAENSLAERTADDGAALADRIVSTLLTWTLLGTAVLTVAVIVLADPLAQLLLTTQSSGESGGALG